MVITFLLLTTFFSGCEKDLYEGSYQQNLKANRISYITGSKALTFTNNITQQIQKYNETHREAEPFDYSTVKYDCIMKVTDALGNKNYTFKVESPNETLSKFYNLVLQEKIDGTSLLKLFEYQMTPEFAEKYIKGEKSFDEFEGSYFYKILANYITDTRYHYSDDDGGGYGGGGSSGGYGGTGGGVYDGNTGVPTGNTGSPGGNNGSNNNSGGVGGLNSDPNDCPPCPQGSGGLSGGGSNGGSGSGSSGGSGGSGGGGGGYMSCTSITITTWCSEHVHLGYDPNCTADTYGGTIMITTCVPIGGSNRPANKTQGDPCPCGSENTNIGIITPETAQALFEAQLMFSSLTVHNIYASLNNDVKRLVNNFIGTNTTNIGLAASFFETLQANNNLTWFSQQSVETQIHLLNYGIGHRFSVNSQTFIQQEIIQMQLTGLTFNLESSANSPLNIDLSLVSGNTPAEIKFNRVYNALIQSPQFKELFINLFGVTNFINAKFKIDNIQQSNPNQITQGNCKLEQYNFGQIYNTITIDRNALLSLSDINIAQIILHECIHAFLNVKLQHPSIGMSIPQINNLDFQTCANTYYNGFSGNQTQHNFFVNNMVPTMVNILNDIRDLLITPQQIFDVVYPSNGAAFIYQPMGNPPSISDIQISWNWNDYFTHLSYNGLQNCSEYPTIYPIGSYADFIRKQYIDAGNVIFNP